MREIEKNEESSTAPGVVGLSLRSKLAVIDFTLK